MGHRPGASFRVKALRLEVLTTTKTDGGGKVIDAVVPRFERVAIAYSGKLGGAKVNRMLVIEPAEGDETTFEFNGYSVVGRYRVVERVNDPETAAVRFRTFGPA